MGKRRIRLAMVGLILAFPPLIEAMAPESGGSWGVVLGRVVLAELVVIVGVAVAAWQRRRMPVVWHGGARTIAAVAPAPGTVARAPRRWVARSVTVP